MSERAGASSRHTSRWCANSRRRGGESLWHSKYGFYRNSSRSTATNARSSFTANNCGRCSRISHSRPEPAARSTASSMRCGRWRRAVAQCPPTLVRRRTPTRFTRSQHARARLRSSLEMADMPSALRPSTSMLGSSKHSCVRLRAGLLRRSQGSGTRQSACALARAGPRTDSTIASGLAPTPHAAAGDAHDRGRRSRRGAAGTWRCDGRRTAAHSSGVDQSSSGADPCAADDCVAAKWPPGRSAASLPAVPPPPGYRSRAGSRRRHQGVGSLDRQRQASVARPGQRRPRRAGVRAAGAHRRWEVRSRVSRAPALGRTRGGHQGDPLGSSPTGPSSSGGSRPRPQLVANLEHPHIVPLYDFWRTPGCAYLVMRLFPEGTLEDLIPVRDPCSSMTSPGLVRQIGAALATAHRRRRRASGCEAGEHLRRRARQLLPWRLRDRPRRRWSGTFAIDSLSVGSPTPASPEQLKRQPVGPAADVRGLAITVFESLSGYLPVADSTTQAERLRYRPNDALPAVESSSDAWAPSANAPRQCRVGSGVRQESCGSAFVGRRIPRRLPGRRGRRRVARIGAAA